MELTNEEMQTSHKLVMCLEKSGKTWVRDRRLLLSLSALFVACGVFLYYQAPPAASFLPNIDGGGNSVTATLPADRADLVRLRRQVQDDILAPWAFVLMYLPVAISVIGGMSVIISTLSRWNKGRQDLLLAKLLQGYLEEKQLLPPSQPK